ncbi:Assimilatory nitrate reductase catalytic subunit [Planctomycetales bacterium 10988]|nr:Assimilatory nitrate reductase catalytic subunit [Planctomycetales bacterium 10988]
MSSLDHDKTAVAELATRTHCPYCAFQCGMVMTHGGETSPLPDIQPDPGFPVNRGQMCIKGFSAGAMLNSDERITQPMIRGKTGVWQKIAWEDALDFCAEQLQSIRKSTGPDSVAVFGSGALTNEKAYLLGKFARVALQTPHIDYNGRYCMASAAGAQNRAFGVDRGLPFPVSDIAQAKTIILWGANSADTLPPIMQWFQQQQENGGRLIVVDPRVSATAQMAQLHLPLVPGSDLALANGLLYLAIEEDLLDWDFIAQRTEGFEALQGRISQYHPALVEKLTGISLRQLRKTVHWLAQSESTMVLSGRGVEQQSKGVDNVQAMINLTLALGKMGKPFSGYGCLTGQGNGQGGREHGQKADQLPGYRLIEDEEDRQAVAKIWGVDPESLPRKGKSAVELIDHLGPEGIRGLLVMGSNLAVASPNLNKVEARLESLDFLVVCDAFFNETSDKGHLFLPTYQWAEEEGTMTNLEGRVILRRQTQLPPDGPRSDLWILAELGKRLGFEEAFYFDSTEAVFDELGQATSGARADYHGITYEKIDQADGVFWPCPNVEHPGTPRMFLEKFAFPNGRARFVPVEHRPPAECPSQEFPLWLTTGRYREHYNSGAQTRMVPRLEQAQPEPRIQIHPRLARSLSITDESWVMAESPRGQGVFRAWLSSDVRHDTVFVPFHWGGMQAVNRLTIPALDPTSRMPEFKVCAVRITPLSEAIAQQWINRTEGEN